MGTLRYLGYGNVSTIEHCISLCKATISCVTAVLDQGTTCHKYQGYFVITDGMQLKQSTDHITAIVMQSKKLHHLKHVQLLCFQ